MTTLYDQFSNARILPHLADCLGSGESCYLVGGAPRDFLLGRLSSDFDFATPFDPTQLAKRFAAKVDGRWFMMDSARNQSRVVLKTVDGNLTYDFAPFRSHSLDDDLRLRDFTINAIAVDLSKTLSAFEIYDPLNGQGDLNQSTLRACSRSVFHDDPLRVLRGIRLALSLNMECDDSTLTLMRAAASGLARVSAERIRSELSLILSFDVAAAAFQRMESLGVLPVVFGSPHHAGAFTEGINQACLVAQRLVTVDSVLPMPSGSKTENGLSYPAIVRLAAFLSGSCALDRHPLLLRQLRFSKKSEVIIRSLAAIDVNRAAEILALSNSERSRALWVSTLGPDPVLCLHYLLCLVDTPEIFLDRVRLAIDDYLKHLCNGRIPDLVDGSWIHSEFGLTEGRFVGYCLRQLRQAEIEGRVLNLNEAHKFLKLLGQKMIDKKNDPS